MGIMDKRYTPTQLRKEINSAYDFFESTSLATIRKMLIDKHGFTEEQCKEFESEYLEKFGESAAEYAILKTMTKRR